MEHSEEKLRTIINNSTELIRILDKNGLIIFDFPSSTRILGYPEGYFVGKNPLDFIHPDDIEKVKKDLKEVYENRNPGLQLNSGSAKPMENSYKWNPSHKI